MFPKSRLFISGQSLFEVVIALAIFSLIAAAFVSLTLGGVSTVSYGTDWLTAGTLADEGVGTKRALRDNAWNALINGVENATFDGRFNRTITVSPVALEAKSLKVEVTWPSPFGVIQKVTRQTKLTNWDSRDWIQTDWSSGQYASVDSTIDVSTAGRISLKAKPSAWSLFVDTGAETWNDIFMISATDGFLVGSGGSIRRWNNPNPNVWNVITPVNTQNLNAIHCSSTTNCFAVGARGTILRWDGSVWSLPSGWNTGSQTWNDVWTFGATSGFVVGASGEIWRHNGSAWARSQDTGNQTWNTVWMFSVTDGVAAGSAGEIRRYNGSNWSLPVGWDTGAQTWNDVWMFSATDGVVVGASGLAQRFDGSNWNTSVTTNTTANINAVYLSPASGWAVGNNATGELILSWNGASFSRVGPSAFLPNVNLLGLHCAALNDCFSGGASGNIFRFAGGGYETSGALISSAFDMGDPSPAQIISWDESVPPCSPACTIKLNIKTAATSADLAAAPWSADFIAPEGTLIDPSYNGQRWVQYRTTLAGDGANTPALQEVRINYK